MQDPTMTTTSVATDTVMHDNERIITEVTVRKSTKNIFLKPYLGQTPCSRFS